MTDPIAAPTSKTRAPRWMKMTLTLSLAANLAIVGLVVGIALRGPVWHEAREGIVELTRALPRDQQRALRNDLRGHRDQLREGMRMQRDLARALADALRATPFNIEGFAEILSEQRSRLGDLRSVAHAALVDRVAQMSDAERDSYADALLERRHDD